MVNFLNVQRHVLYIERKNKALGFGMTLTEKFARLGIWDVESVRENLSWYYSVAINQMPAKYLIARRIPCDIDLKEATEEELWKEHERLTQKFLRVWEKIRTRKIRLADLPKAFPSLMDLNVELVNRMLTHCNFCRWNCRVNRVDGKKLGVCKLGTRSNVSSFFHHRGEELVFRGVGGSGTIFFSSCNMRCLFCQNGDISRDKDRGIAFTPRQLATAAVLLRLEGCHNINFVGGDPTIHLHTIVNAINYLDQLKLEEKDIRYVSRVKADYFVSYDLRAKEAYYDGEFNVPLLWNSNFYMSDETMRILRTIIDIWLPDFKFGNNKCALRLSRTPRYFETVAKNHKLIYDWGESFVIRHLIMPNHVECCTKPIFQWIKENIPNALINVMDQYHPDSFADPRNPQFDEKRCGDIARFPTKGEIMETMYYAKELGLNFEEITFEKSVFGIRL